ncbi:MAG: DUF4290 domain-containing protein [Tannerella sp.]|jgi:hypothetical protein|nr:DUF4290 domain-containing protein [Tannerella sp.]
MNKIIYNTKQKRLALPEYGRNIQNMVDFCLTIPDREARTVCAYSIVDTMGAMLPELTEVNDYHRLLWDHLAIMADFKLDVDFPFEVVGREQLHRRPPVVRIPKARMRYRHYGQILEGLIKKASVMEEGEEKEVLVRMIATQMKKSYLTWNKDSVDNYKILKDLYDMSEGTVIRHPEQFKIPDVSGLVEVAPPKPVGPSKKKKKKNKQK